MRLSICNGEVAGSSPVLPLLQKLAVWSQRVVPAQLDRFESWFLLVWSAAERLSPCTGSASIY